MRLTDSPEALPGSCFICGNASRDSYIDTGISIEFHGAIYLCNTCLEEAAQLLGFIVPREAARLRLENDDYRTEIYNLKRQLDGLEMAVNGFTLARGVGGFDPLPGFDLATGSTDQSSDDSNRDLGEGTREALEQVHDEGVAELPNDGKPTGFVLDL